jgi:hypothetical protein
MLIIFKKELESHAEHSGVWMKLFKVFLVDWVVFVLEVLGTGILFIIIFNLAH